MSSTVLGPPVGYVDLLNEETKEYIKKNAGKFQKSPLRPSASGKCARELYYELMEFSGKASYPKELMGPDVHRLLNLGHSVEYHVIKQFELLKSLFEIRYKQQVLSFQYLKAENNPGLSQWLEGSLDLVFWSEKYKCVADVKSKKDRSYGRMTAWEKMSGQLEHMESIEKIGDNSYWADNLEAFLLELNDPFFEANFKQLNLYACSDFLRERGIDHGAILQYNKNTSQLREVRFRPSLELYRKTIQKFQDVLTAVDTGNPELAPQEYAKGTFKCNYCAYKAQCWGTAEEKTQKAMKKVGKT